MTDCPYCGCTKLYKRSQRPSWKCAGCGRESSEYIGTILTHRKKPLEWYQRVRELHESGMHPRGIMRLMGMKDAKSIYVYVQKLKMQEQNDDRKTQG